MFKAGDQIAGFMSHNNEVVREIVEVRETGYTWKYPDNEPPSLKNTWISENSNDPFFAMGWKLLCGKK